MQLLDYSHAIQAPYLMNLPVRGHYHHNLANAHKHMVPNYATHGSLCFSIHYSALLVRFVLYTGSHGVVTMQQVDLASLSCTILVVEW